MAAATAVSAAAKQMQARENLSIVNPFVLNTNRIGIFDTDSIATSRKTQNDSHCIFCVKLGSA